MTTFLVVVATKMVVKKTRKSRLEVAKTGRDFFGSWSRPIWAKKVGRNFLVRCNQGRLQEFGFTANPLKCEWGVAETDFLSYWITKTGSKPWEKRIEPILKMEEPKTLKELRRFVGLTNWYRRMYKN